MAVELLIVQIVVGPVPVSSARAWLDYAEDTLEHLRSVDDVELPRPAFDAFEEILEEWRTIAKADEPFRWVSEQSPERAEYLISALYHVGNVVEREAAAGRRPLRPKEADEFHVRLISSVLVALEAEGTPYDQFVREIRGDWDIAGLQ